MRVWKWIFLTLLVAAAAAAAWKFTGGSKAAPTVLATAEIKTGDVRKVLEATGIIKAQVGAIIKIGARATGTIKEMRVKVGDEVKKGQLIALIDDREDLSRLDEAEAKLSRAEAELAQVEAVYPRRIAEAKAEQALSKAKSEYAATNLKRQNELYQKSLVARDVLDAAKRDQLVSANEVLAREALEIRLETEFVKERIKAEKVIEEARAVIASLKTKISYTRIISPIDGVVAFVTTQQGETIVAGLQVANLITVLDPTRLEMWIYVDETDVGQIKPGMPVEFRVDAFRDTVFKGEVDQIYPQPEIRDNIVYYQALVRLDPAESRKLRPEMTTQCQIVVKELKGVLVIPNAALKWVGDQQVVFLVDPAGAVRQIKPELGLAGLAETEVLSGLEAGQKVATQIVLPETGQAKSKPAAAPRPPGPGRP